jgi:hypothetical protein
VSDAVERVTHAFCRQGTDPVLRARGRGYQATVADGLEFVAFDPVVDKVSIRAQFCTRAFRRGGGGAVAKTPAPPIWFMEGNTAQALLDAASGLVEHCEAGPAGIEVAWVMSQAPSGQGDMVIEAEMTGVQFSRQSPSGLHFADGSGRARVKLGLAKAVDRQGRTWPVSIDGRGPILRVLVPEEALAQARFPLAIDPLISAEFGLDQPLDGPAPCTRAAPLIAANDSAYLVVCQQQRGRTNRLRGRGRP